MSMLFKPPKVKVPKAEAPAPPPTIDQVVREHIESGRLRRRRGSRSNSLTGPLGAIIPAGAAQPKQLTGQ